MDCTTLNIFQNVLGAYNVRAYDVTWEPDGMTFALDESTEVTVMCYHVNYHTYNDYKVRVVKFDEDDRVVGVMTESTDVKRVISPSTLICEAIEKCESKFASRRKED